MALHGYSVTIRSPVTRLKDIASMRTILLFITRYAWLVLLLGLGLMGMALHSVWKASGDNAWSAREQLATIEGTVIKATEVTVQSRRSKKQHYQLDVRDAGGTTHELRMDISTPRELVAHIVQEPVAALADPDDNYLVYEISLAGRDPLMPYEHTRQRLQTEAERAARTFNNAGVWGGALCLALLGGAGVWGRRKLLAAPRET